MLAGTDPGVNQATQLSSSLGTVGVLPHTLERGCLPWEAAKWQSFEHCTYYLHQSFCLLPDPGAIKAALGCLNFLMHELDNQTLDQVTGSEQTYPGALLLQVREGLKALEQITGTWYVCLCKQTLEHLCCR